ncbi:hypothetical protein [Streptomyces sp. NBC_01314]|uniref:DUF6907 domain-containing protein n=1 Tax=Streptomyces sp. NBC_01314 TaxID=2903821 RepID=UPI003085BBD6|nr:hypothetical protein OG622_32535 [Streptomyces sp. NBC_01314]
MTSRTVTLPTTDFGNVTLLEPGWCIGHPNHRPEDQRVDILHSGPDVTLTFRGHHIADACLVQSPFTTIDIPEICSRMPGVSVSLIGRTLDPVGLHEMAATLDGYADRLRDMADELTQLLGRSGA